MTHDNAPVAPAQPPTAPPPGPRRWLSWLGWPVRRLLMLLLVGYRRFISPALPPTCKYYPSCSTYALQALQHHGAAKGSLLATWRVMRCNPWSKGGWDPIPPSGQWLPEVYPDGRPRQ